METVDDKTSILVSSKKWMKGKTIFVRIRDELEKRGCLNHKELERDRGFFNILV